MIELTLENWENQVDNHEGYVLVDWWNEACEACIAIMPTVENFEKVYGNELKFTKFNTSQKGTKRFCIQQRVMGLPVIAIYKNGEKLDELIKDDCDAYNIEMLIKKYI